MGLFDRLERKIETAVNGAFAKAFKSSVQPVEIASAIRRAMDDKAAVASAGRTLVPNLYTVELSTTDYDSLTQYSDDLTDEIIASAEEHADSQRYSPAGPLRVIFSENTELETGVFALRPASAKDPYAVGPRARVDRAAPPRGSVEFAPAAHAPHELPVPGSRPHRGGGRQQDQVEGYRARRGLEPGEVEPGQYDEPDHDGHDDELDDPRRSDARPLPVAERDEPRHNGNGYNDDHQSADDPDAATAAYVPPHVDEPVVRTSPIRRPWLDIEGDRYPLLGAITTIGRDATADIVLDDPGISRTHAEIRVTNDGPRYVATIRDLGSTNGTFVNGDRATSTRIDDGDRVTIGRTSFLFRIGKR